MHVELRDITKRGWKQDESGTEISEENINDPMLAVEGVDAQFAEHVRVGKIWYVRAPEREQKRLKHEWASRA